MLNETTYKEKFIQLKNWLPNLIESVRKELKNEHLKQDPLFVKKYFSNKSLSKITNEELVDGYTLALQDEDRAEHLAEFISNRWLMNHGDIYHYFEENLRQINPDFEKIEEIEQKKAEHIMEGAVKLFGAPNTYFFSVINSVAFPKTLYADLNNKAEVQAAHDTKAALDAESAKKAEITQRGFEEQISRLTDKYEKKLSGLQKKYQIDVEGLKKQVAQLQRKLNEK